MHWLKEHGITSSWFEYDQLPFDVLQDARLQMEYDVLKTQVEAQRGKH